jgi:hypothetical protein
MGSWQEDIGSEITRLENYRTKLLQDDLSRAGQPPSDSQKRAVTTVSNNFLAYQNVNRQLSEIIKRSTPPDLGGTLSTIGSNQQKINSLKKEIQLAKNDLDVAKQRDKQIQLDPPQQSNYQGISIYFGLIKPVHFISISILFGISILLLISAVLLLKENFLLGFPVASISISGVTPTSTSFYKDPRLYATIAGASLIVIIFLSLKIANKLPVLPT